MSVSSVQKWHKKFKTGQDAVTDQPRPGRPKSGRSEDNIIMVRALVDQDRCKTVRKLSEESALPVATVFRILKHDLQMRLVNAKFVPRLLSDEQKAFRKRLCEENLMRFLDEDTFTARIVTGDETWVSVFEPETKNESRQWQEKGEQRPQKAIKSRSRKKSMLTVFFNVDGIVLIQFTRPPGTIDTDSYCATLALLKERIRRKRPHLWTNPDTKFLLHHDNALAHMATRTLAKIGQWGIEMVPHPPYSPDLAPCDFALFPKLKSLLRGRHFANVRELEDETSKILRGLPPDFFKGAIKEMAERWAKCVQSEGNFFEGTHVRLPSDTETSTEDKENPHTTPEYSCCCRSTACTVAGL